MLEIIKNRSSFADSDLVKMVRRENNAKRNYLLVNSTQGKHVPADPEKVLELFRQLAEEVKKHISDEKIIFIGFAETATAVGAGVAGEFDGSFYVHTTREKDDKAVPVAEFKEEHSHAVEQILYCNEWEKEAEKADRIVFVEDEITTGKTIMNFVNVLKSEGKVRENMKFSACSILNGMTVSREDELKKEGMEFFWLVKHRASPDSDEVYTFNAEQKKREDHYELSVIKTEGRTDPRKGLKMSEYERSCDILAEKLKDLINVKGLKTAVVGTEECMFPAINTALLLKRTGALSVVTHSSTRSPIVADKAEGYPLKSRYQVESFYEKERRTFIYNSDSAAYDIVIVITDSEKEDYDFTSFADAFSGTKKFILVRWVN